MVEIRQNSARLSSRNPWSRIRLRVATMRAMSRARTKTMQLACQSDLNRLLVICYGNIYRSPFVAAYLSRFLGTQRRSFVRSAGFHPRSGRRCTEEFVEYVQGRFEIDLSIHRSNTVSQADVDWADGIIVMDRHNWHGLAAMGRGSQEKAIWLGTLVEDEGVEIADPYDKPRKEMIKIVDRLVAGSECLLKLMG